ncbi:MAG: hypothetical protein NC245_17190 [Muribaculum sp.]|nr:hypothetical protein [Muribaculum sp.]
MADSKRKKVIQKEAPNGKHIAQGGDPERYYLEKPAWTFANSDQEKWTFSQDRFWAEILPRLKELETQTWSEILVHGKEQNHSLDLNKLNKVAQDRLTSKCIEAESLISLRITGKHRLYGYMTGRVFNILWYDMSIFMAGNGRMAIHTMIGL